MTCFKAFRACVKMSNPHYSREFVTNPLRRDARRARGGRGADTLPRVFVGVCPRPNGTGTVADDGACPHAVCWATEQRARPRKVCGSGVSAVAVEVCVNNAG
jgi:hypothetical protein